MKKKLIYILIFAAILAFLLHKSEISEFKEFVQKNEPILNLGDFLNEEKWNKVALVTPYGIFCMAQDCISSTDDSEQFLVFIQDEKIIAHFEIGNVVTFAEWPYWITRELAVFQKNPLDNVYEFSTANLLDKDSVVMKKFILNSPNGSKSYCQLFLSGNANCFYETEKECESNLKDSDEVCVVNQPGVIKQVPYKWREIRSENSP